MTVKAPSPEDCVRFCLRSYLKERDLEKTLACLREDVLWVGASAGEIGSNRLEVEQLLRSEFRFYPHGFNVRISNFRSRYMDRAAICSCAVEAKSLEPGTSSIVANVRMTFCCIDTEDGWKIETMHSSLPMALREADDYYPVRLKEEAAGDFERRLSRKTMDLLNRSIPGGIMGGYLEPDFPLYYVNERMLEYLGYTYEEFERAIDGLVINCMHPDDRAMVEHDVEAAFAAGREYEVRYRMRKKDGSWIWVNDIGRKGIADDGRPVCLSVVSDISREMETSLRLTAEAAEKEKQTRRYDKLFMSALCGIVQYRINPDGKTVNFKNANLEAIRIFGYTPEDFWARTVWEMQDIVADEDLERILAELSCLGAVGDKQNYEYRLKRKDGSPCWIIGNAEVIRDTDGDIVVQSVFLDIDSSKQAASRQQMLTEQVEAGNALLRMALEHTSTCEFYYYPAEGRAILPSRTSGHYRCRASYDAMPESLAQDLVAEEWQSVYDALFLKIRSGEKTATAEFKVKAGEAWCRITMSTVSSLETGEPSFVVGILEDITKAKKMEFALDQARSRDRLTGLYNRDAGVRMVREYMDRKSPDQVCALMLLDMDDFSTLNAEEGKAFGDAILQDVSRILLAETAKDDIHIRLGGDEFMLFIKNCDKARATILGPKIADKVRELFVPEHREFQVSASIGMCVTAVVDEYSGLYRCADSTLQYVKEHNKGKACCYLDTSNEIGAVLTQIYTGEHLFNEIRSASDGHGDDLISFALELMGKAKRLTDAISLLLARIGQHCGLDRISIIEANPEYLSVNVTSQWVRKRMDSWKEQTLFLPREKFDEVLIGFDEEGFSRKNNHKGALASCLKIAIWSQGGYAGILCFESRRSDFAWTSELRKLLAELTKLISSFIMKARADSVSQAKTDFLSRMSHEIRTPMNAIAGMTTIAKSVLDDKERALDCLNKIESANGYLIDLINDILDMSRIESGKLELNNEDVDLAWQLEKLLGLLMPQAIAEDIALILENGFQINRPVRVDMLRLNQILVNIIGNALKFTPSGGTVRLSVVPEEENQNYVRLRFAVQDTGIGIDKDSILRIFNAFEQAEKSTSAKYGGTGLGLSISSRLVQMMGGTLGVESEVGKGSNFYFSLPLAFSECSSPDAGSSCLASPPVEFRGVRLLLAEDNELNREIAETLLTMNGFTVESAQDGREAVDMFARREEGYYQAILMDIRMPNMDGLEAARHIRTLGRNDSRTVPIIALTANAFDEDSRKSLESGMNCHLSKPIIVETLLETLRHFLA